MSRDRAIAIPVNRDTRTFEQHRRDFFKGLENNFHSNGNRHSKSIMPYREHGFDDNWFNEVDDWIKSSWDHWNDEMNRIRRGMLQLMPLDDFGMNDWDTHEPNSLIRQMEQRMQEMRKRMGISDMPPFKATFDDFLNDPYEIGKDGKLHFKVRFDVKGFSPEDINVKTTDNGVVVSAKKVTQTNTSKSSREFCRMIELPQSIEQTKLECHLTDDGVLLLEAPVKNNDHKSVTFNNKPQLAIRPKSAFSRPTTPRNGRKSPAKPLILKGTPGPTIIDDGYKGKRLHVEIPIDPMYKSEDLCINVEPNNRLVVSGKHTKHTGEGVRLRRTSSPSAQFTHSYEIPQAVDPSSITSEIVGNTLIIEAPLNKSYSSYY